MPRRRKYTRQVERENMPSLSELPNNINRKRFTKALERLGFEISKRGGKGSHIKATFISNQKSITIPSNFRKDVLCYIIKAIEEQTGVTWDDIKDKL